MNQNMQLKEIKAIVRKQLKKNFPGWKRLNKREKREISNNPHALRAQQKMKH